MQTPFANSIFLTTDHADAQLQGNEAHHGDALQVLTAAEMAQVAGGLDSTTDLPVSTW